MPTLQGREELAAERRRMQTLREEHSQAGLHQHEHVQELRREFGG